MTTSSDPIREFSSFRDPAGHLYTEDGVLYRRVEPRYFEQYRCLMGSGLYDELRKFDAIVEHEEISSDPEKIIIRPKRIPYISYPYEWSFGMLRDAALLTLKIHRRALRHDMVLKDASAYNIQFDHGTPKLIDTLSFDFYKEGIPWGAYGQFCRHFLAPLLLMREKDVRMNRMLTLFIDGIPLDMAASLLGRKGGMLARQHIVWHARSVERHNEDGKLQGDASQIVQPTLSRKQHLALVESLIRGIEGLSLRHVETEWGDYYAHTNYSEEAGNQKHDIVSDYLAEINPKSVWDLGANDGTYSRLGIAQGAEVVAFDIDPIAVERNYQSAKREKTAILPLILDLTNPSPGIGFANMERETIVGRGRPDCVMALALIHHLAISNNLPLSMLAEWFASLSDSLIIEWVPKEDSQVRILLATRDDIFPQYTEDYFEEAFMTCYESCKKREIAGSHRKIYCFKHRREHD